VEEELRDERLDVHDERPAENSMFEGWGKA
jgi:hypothetical protein